MKRKIKKINDSFNKTDMEYLKKLEIAWKKSIQRFSDADYLKIFPEAREIIPCKILEWKRVQVEIKQAVAEDFRCVYSTKKKMGIETTKLLNLIIKSMHGPRLVEAEKQLRRLNHLLSLGNGKNLRSNKISDQDIAIAKRVPILDIASELSNLKKVSGGYMARCCFHDDNNPSMKIYIETNSFYCFGCGAHGDVVTFIMKQENLNFLAAIRKLIQYG